MVSYQDYFLAVKKKYENAGWQTIGAPNIVINDIIAKKNDKFHFVKILTDEQSDKNLAEIQKNDFIQNAFSNGATPVYAHVKSTKTNKIKMSFENINTNNRIIIRTSPQQRAQPEQTINNPQQSKNKASKKTTHKQSKKK